MQSVITLIVKDGCKLPRPLTDIQLILQELGWKTDWLSLNPLTNPVYSLMVKMNTVRVL